jgi:hypothetical protein
VGSAASAVAVGASPPVAVASAGFESLVGLSASLVLFFPLNKPLILALSSESALGAVLIVMSE